jgi:hypothetical protein
MDAFSALVVLSLCGMLFPTCFETFSARNSRSAGDPRCQPSLGTPVELEIIFEVSPASRTVQLTPGRHLLMYPRPSGEGWHLVAFLQQGPGGPILGVVCQVL